MASEGEEVSEVAGLSLADSVRGDEAFLCSLRTSLEVDIPVAAYKVGTYIWRIDLSFYTSQR